jgi:hypothetical protein
VLRFFFKRFLKLLSPLLCLATNLFASPVADLETWLKIDRKTRPLLESQAFANTPLSALESEQAKTLIWTERTAYLKTLWTTPWTNKRLINKDNLAMPFDYRIYGSKPAAGYDLYISMHGGGETTKEANDQQWQNQILLYHPPGIYLAPRAPTDAWNMWHKDHIDGFFDQIIQSATVFLNANPNRVYLMGYSAGGDGAYQMAPRMADRWAAAAMMAGYPNQASPINLRNIGFTLHVGGLDAAYNRNTIAVTYGNEIKKLQDAETEPGFYKYLVQVHANKPHWMDLEDTVALSWMDNFTRKPNPKKVIWHQDTTVGTNSFPSGPVIPVQGFPTQTQFYWIGLQNKKLAKPGVLITAEIKGQAVSILNSSIDSMVVMLNDSLLDLDKPVAIFWKGLKLQDALVLRTIENLYSTSEARGDKDYIYSAQIKVGKSGTSALLKSRISRSKNPALKRLGRIYNLKGQRDKQSRCIHP